MELMVQQAVPVKIRSDAKEVRVVDSILVVSICVGVVSKEPRLGKALRHLTASFPLAECQNKRMIL